MRDTLRDAPEVSVVLACRNEEDNAEAIATAVIEKLEPIVKDFELIFIDNESQDRTVEIVRDLCARDPRIRLIINTRNFGQMRSPIRNLSGERSRGDFNVLRFSGHA